MPKTKPLIYPFTYEEWLSHPSTKPKLKAIKKLCERLKKENKKTIQLKLF